MIDLISSEYGWDERVIMDEIPYRRLEQYMIEISTRYDKPITREIDPVPADAQFNELLSQVIAKKQSERHSKEKRLN